MILPARQLACAQEAILLAPEVESCGLLVGRSHGRQVVVGWFAFCANLSHDPDEFILAPQDHHRIVAELAGDETVVGIFHSHRGSAAPSSADAQNMKFHDLPWLIFGNTSSASLGDLVCRAYLLDERGRVVEVKIRLAEE
ncbi:MAG: [CysO sulfur-carrier protein]-S-L-cysteine hydrolase [Acidobacteriota bacterium]|jgi:proteasome lid subunit RPN8/RPN11|nr:[CysO sulfur-carrier protein]-S-L-cysteine hydrolase [Acidobacteriota bacterium]